MGPCTHQYTETNITVGHRTKSEQKAPLTDHYIFLSDKMSGQKLQTTLYFPSAGRISKSGM